jgi:hypothetical protein
MSEQPENPRIEVRPARPDVSEHRELPPQRDRDPAPDSHTAYDTDYYQELRYQVIDRGSGTSLSGTSMGALTKAYERLSSAYIKTRKTPRSTSHGYYSDLPTQPSAQALTRIRASFAELLTQIQAAQTRPENQEPMLGLVHEAIDHAAHEQPNMSLLTWYLNALIVKSTDEATTDAIVKVQMDIHMALGYYPKPQA